MSVSKPKDDLNSVERVGLLTDVHLEPMHQNGKMKDVEDREELNDQNATIGPRGWKFWAVFMSVVFTQMLMTLGSNITSTALPTIIDDIGTSDQFVWIINAFSLSSTIIQPPIGQIADIFGRKIPTIISVLNFSLGSAICGISTNLTLMVIGRAVQGLGAGGIFVLADLITSDLVPLRERPKFLGLLLAGSAVSLIAGPFLGGIITQYLSWRWIFFLNVPIGGFIIVLLWLFLNLKHQQHRTWKHAIKEIDFLGTIVFSAAAIAMMLALASSDGFWTSKAYTLSFVLGCLGLILFGVLQNSRFCPSPIMPLRLFNLASSLVFMITFLSSTILMLVPYFLAIYFQAVLQDSPTEAGVDLLATVVVLLPAAMVIGGLVSKTGHYRIAHISSFALTAISMAGFMLTDDHTATMNWIVLSVLGAIGMGALIPTALPAAQAPLPDSDAAAVTAAFSFFRSFGLLWGFSIPAFMFNAEVENAITVVQDEHIAGMLLNGGAFGNARSEFIAGLSEPARTQVIEVFIRSLRVVWKGAFAISLFGLALAFLETEKKLRTTLETEFQIDDSPWKNSTRPVDSEIALTRSPSQETIISEYKDSDSPSTS
ncbi:MFS general substrate transporter [Mollisia scopiformis]|uniref:MFS general substrate transporter n=1 Tax=Mollisia scopiformis TaxID=149040 RepID=A0A194XT53_MOLSC|nr:MFS general substrate transporter [Mollisia scopiformis]KUJ23229.1 MFS general substrate transporter [Mollisia scopiformis]